MYNLGANISQQMKFSDTLETRPLNNIKSNLLILLFYVISFANCFWSSLFYFVTFLRFVWLGLGAGCRTYTYTAVNQLYLGNNFLRILTIFRFHILHLFLRPRNETDGEFLSIKCHSVSRRLKKNM